SQATDGVEDAYDGNLVQWCRDYVTNQTSRGKGKQVGVRGMSELLQRIDALRIEHDKHGIDAMVGQAGLYAERAIKDDDDRDTAREAVAELTADAAQFRPE